MKRRNTPSKQAVLELLQTAKRAMNQDDIVQQVKDSMDRVTVYRILNSFCNDGYIHRIVGDDGRNYFAMCIDCKEHHHRHDHFHFRCTTCEKVECLHEEVQVRVPKGYVLETVNCMLTGTCGACA